MSGPRVVLLPRRHHGDSSKFGRPCCRSIRVSVRHCARSGSTSPIPWRRLCGGRSRPSGWIGSALSVSFSLYVQPHFERLDPGFDELLLTAPANMALSLVGVFGGRADEFNAEADGVPALEHVEEVPTAPDSLLVRFPMHWTRQRNRDSAARFYRRPLCHGCLLAERPCATAMRPMGVLGSGLTQAMCWRISPAIPLPWSVPGIPNLCSRMWQCTPRCFRPTGTESTTGLFFFSK